MSTATRTIAAIARSIPVPVPHPPMAEDDAS